jgi:phosphinothricin acetyltransferase
MCNIRPAHISDLGAITEIYNEAILTTTATFDTELKTEDEQRVWFNSHGAQYPIVVAESNRIVVGWHPSVSGQIVAATAEQLRSPSM